MSPARTNARRGSDPTHRNGAEDGAEDGEDMLDKSFDEMRQRMSAASDAGEVPLLSPTRPRAVKSNNANS